MRKSKIWFYVYLSVFLMILLMNPLNTYKNRNNQFNNQDIETTRSTNPKTSAILPNEIWNVSWTGGQYPEAYASEIDLDSKNNIYVTGQFGLIENNNITINKTDNMGKPLWNKIIDETEYNDGGNGIICDDLDNIYVTGSVNASSPSSEDVFIAKYNESGDLKWFKTWGGSGSDHGEDITIDSEGNIYVVGYTSSYGVENGAILLLKFNNTGDFKWNQTWDTVHSEGGDSIDYDKLSNHLYIAGGQQIGPIPNFDRNAILLKYNTTLDKKWERIWDIGLNETGGGVKVDLSGNVYLTGEVYNFTLDCDDAFLVKYNSSGIQLWNLTWNLWVDNLSADDIEIDTSNNVYVVGFIKIFDPDVWLGIHSSDGKKLYNMTWGSSNYDEGGNGIVLDSSNYIYITGSAYFALNFANQFIVKLSPYNRLESIPSEDNGNDDDDNNGGNHSILGYDLFIMIFLLSIISVHIIIKKFSKFK